MLANKYAKKLGTNTNAFISQEHARTLNVGGFVHCVCNRSSQHRRSLKYNHCQYLFVFSVHNILRSSSELCVISKIDTQTWRTWYDKFGHFWTWQDNLANLAKWNPVSRCGTHLRWKGGACEILTFGAPSACACVRFWAWYLTRFWYDNQVHINPVEVRKMHSAEHVARSNVVLCVGNHLSNMSYVPNPPSVRVTYPRGTQSVFLCQGHGFHQTQPWVPDVTRAADVLSAPCFLSVVGWGRKPTLSLRYFS